MKIAVIYNNSISCGVGFYFLKAFQKTQHDIQHFSLKDADKIPRHFDLYVRIDEGDYETKDLPNELRPRLFYAVDTHIPRSRKHMETFVSSYDIIFCAQYLGAEEWKKKYKQVYWVPLACDPEVHRAQKQDFKFDIGFVGSDAGARYDRRFYLQALRERYPNSFLKKWPFLKMHEIYNASKIGFNFAINNDINMRTFEVMSCGSMLLTNDISDPMFKKLFKENEDFVLYKSFKDLCEKIDYFLTHEKERQAIATSGHKKTIENHTYPNRVSEMLNIFSNLDFHKER